LAPEYNLEELCHAICQTTGVKVALRYRHIQDDLPNTATWPSPRAKAIHLEVEYKEPHTHCQQIHSAFAPQATVFPLGIKMWLIEEMQDLTNPVAQSTASKIHALQATFLEYSKTDLFHIQPHLANQKEKIYATLRQFLSTSTGPTEATQKPFYAVSAMVKKAGFIIRYLPQHHDSVRTVMAQISDTLTGVPAGLNKLVSHNQHITSAPCKANNLSPVPMPNQPPAEMHAATAQPQLTPNSRTKLNTGPQQTLSNEGSKAT